jgi:hypothetical protein
MAHTAALGHLEKPVACGEWADLDGFEQNIEAGIAGHCVSPRLQKKAANQQRHDKLAWRLRDNKLSAGVGRSTRMPTPIRGCFQVQLDWRGGDGLNSAPIKSESSIVLDRPNLRASLWAILYSLLVVVGCSSMIDLGISYYVVVPVGLFVFPLLASAPFLIWLRSPSRDTGG